ncbi:ead/Ea22-like family protein [Enterobacter hormaechei]|uniref:ead/Ea22-like family protein n=1 Tax=Enterobacter hormaechei TaxID=158836 RepID=UPI0020210FBF|nr:ead/Ea22-like family protein [Enterobacter hormaechei]MCL8092706.1 ead/Ea22-like family protein [Enterobacter hormaechei]MCM7337408.1 ead/Ea22-like family protein [Enterobacter hormaechei]MCM8388591.1 ead/Ea22-like family protein [Enterobacter hormaechei]MDA4637685.1 ead/Ea22-like family protein [Enterobacter hormaechei]
MSNINKQELREAAERAEPDSWGYDRDEFNEALTPSTVLALLDELEAKDKRITELEAKLETADKLQDSSFRHGLQHGFSLGQTDNQAGFEQAIHAYGQQWKGE